MFGGKKEWILVGFIQIYMFSSKGKSARIWDKKTANIYEKRKLSKKLELILSHIQGWILRVLHSHSVLPLRWGVLLY